MATVKNNAAHVKSISFNVDLSSKTPHDVTRTLVLRPLINVLNDEESELWAKMSDKTLGKAEKGKKAMPLGHPDVLALLAEGVLVDLTAFAKTAGELPKTLADLDINIALHFATGILDLDVLKRWLRSEKRDQVIQAMTEHIDALEGMAKAAA